MPEPGVVAKVPGVPPSPKEPGVAAKVPGVPPSPKEPEVVAKPPGIPAAALLAAIPAHPGPVAKRPAPPPGGKAHPAPVVKRPAPPPAVAPFPRFTLQLLGESTTAMTNFVRRSLRDLESKSDVHEQGLQETKARLFAEYC